MSENKTKAPATRQKESGWGSDNEHESELMASAMPPLFGLAASPAQPNPGDKKSFEDDIEADTKGIVVAGIPPVAVAEIIKFEDLKFHVYNDSLGIPTAGIGHKLSEAEKKKFSVGTKVSKAQIEAWAKADMTSAWNASLSQCAKLEITQSAFQVALFSVNFQLGIHWNTKHVKTWGYMLEGDWENAALEAANSTWNTQTPVRVSAFQEALRNLPPKGSKGSKGASAKATENATKSVGKSLAPKTAKPSAKSPSPKTAEPTGKDRVKAVQTKLKALGHYTGAIDGIEFRRDKKESNTTKGIKAFQKSKNLPVTGKVDPATWNALNGKSKPKTVSDWMKEKVAESKEAVKASEAKGWGSDREVGKGEAEKGHVAESGDTIAPLLGAAEFYSQLHPSKGTDRSIPREVAFSGALAKYDHGGSADIYDEAKCKKAWRGLTVSKREIKVYDLACKNTCDYILRNAGYSGSGPNESIFSLLEQKAANGDISLSPTESVDESRNRLDQYLESGMPVLVGVDWKSKGANPGSPTDHFLVVVGRGNDEKGKFYQYLDVGRAQTSAGADFVSNRIYVGFGKSSSKDSNWTSGPKPNNAAKDYSLSEVRKMSKI